VAARSRRPVWKLFLGRSVAWRTRRNETKELTRLKAVQRFKLSAARATSGALPRPGRLTCWNSCSTLLGLVLGYPLDSLPIPSASFDAIRVRMAPLKSCLLKGVLTWAYTAVMIYSSGFCSPGSMSRSGSVGSK
jgi:hypothetical protein